MSHPSKPSRSERVLLLSAVIFALGPIVPVVKAVLAIMESVSPGSTTRPIGCIELALGFPILLAVIIISVVIGSILWLLVMRHFFAKEVLEPYFASRYPCFLET